MIDMVQKKTETEFKKSLAGLVYILKKCFLGMVICGVIIGGIVGVINETSGTRGIYNCAVKNTTVNNTGAYGDVYSGALFCGMFNISNSTVEFEGCTVENNTQEGKFVGDLYYSADDDITVQIK